jgi:hypothetical protein
MEDHKDGASWYRILFNDRIHVGFNLWCDPGMITHVVCIELGFGQIVFHGFYFYLSHSPMTKSNEPRMAGISASRWPGRITGKILRVKNEGGRILNR